MINFFKKSFFIRIMFLVLFVLIISFVATTVIYTVAAEKIFVSHQMEKLKEETDMLTLLLADEWANKDYLIHFFDKVFQVESSILSSYVIISDRINAEIYTYLPSTQRTTVVLERQQLDRYYKQNLSSYFRQAVSGLYVSFIETDNIFDSEIIVIMRPIISENNQVEAVLTVLKFTDDYESQLKNVNVILVLTMLGVAAMMALPVYLMSKSITKPLRRIKRVAIELGKGNFGVKAADNYPAEMGQLATTLNTLSTRLSITIKHLTHETTVLQGVLNSMNQGICVLDEKMNIVLTNPAIFKIFNTDPDYFEKEKIIPLAEIWNDFSKCIETKIGTVNTHPYGKITVLSAINPLIIQDVSSGAIGIFSDVTREVRLEQTRKEYVANVSHELKTPLTGIMGLIEPIKEGIVTDPEKISRYHQIISDEVARLNRLINDLLSLSQLQSSTDVFSVTRIDLNEIIKDTVEKFNFMTLTDHNRIIYEHPDLPVFAIGNVDRIEQILTILIDNALKFSEREVSSKISIKIDIKQDKNKYIVSVSDNGPGIKPDDLPYIFDRFFKTDKARSGGGSGLGLAIAKETLKQLGENIWAESDGKSGTVFFFTLSAHEKTNEAHKAD